MISKTVLRLFAVVLFFLIFIPEKAFALSVAPAFSDLSVKPGESRDIDIFIKNTDKVSIKFWPEAGDITFNEEGVAQLITPSYQKIKDNTMLMSQWIELTEGPFTLAPGEKITYKVSFKVPPDAEPGGHYGAIIFSQQPTLTIGKPADIFLSTKLTSLIYMDVAGQSRKTFMINRFQTGDKVYTSMPVSIQLELKNTGNVHLFPHGLVSVINEFTGKKMTDLIVNDEAIYLMPKTHKLFKLSWDTRGLELFQPKFWGKYKITGQLAAQGAPRVNTTGSFWLIPVIPITIEFIIIGAFFMLAGWILKKLKSKR